MSRLAVFMVVSAFVALSIGTNEIFPTDEDDMKKTQDSILDFKVQMKQMNQRLVNLETQNDHLKMQNNKLIMQNLKQQERNNQLENNFIETKTEMEILKKHQLADSAVLQNLTSKFQQGYVAFTAYPGSPREYNAGEIVQFENIVDNYGGHYDPASGVFTCPYDGFYLFTISVTTDTDRVADLNLMIDNTFMTGVLVRRPNDLTQATTVTVAECNGGQMVYVECSGDGHFVYGSGGRHTTFTGALIQQTVP